MGYARDEAGEMIAVMAVNLIGISDGGHAELMAIWKGMELAKDLGLPKVIVESNCAPVVHKIYGGNDDMSHLDHLIEAYNRSSSNTLIGIFYI